MKLGNMFKKTNQKNYITLTNRKANVQNSGESSPEVPEGLMRKCNACRAVLLAESIIGNQYICPKCGNYFSVPARRRIEMLADEESFKEWDTGLTSGNPLHYKGYEDKVEALREKTGLDEAVTTGLARIGGHEVVLAVCDSHFMMASMGKVVGEKLTRAIEKATERKVPVIIVACSGIAKLRRTFSLVLRPFSWAITVTGIPWNLAIPPTMAGSSPKYLSPCSSVKSENKSSIYSVPTGLSFFLEARTLSQADFFSSFFAMDNSSLIFRSGFSDDSDTSL